MSYFSHDNKAGGSYGSIITKFSKDSKAGKLFPYNSVQHDNDEEEDIIEDPMSFDISNKINYSNFSCAPGNNRTDKYTLGTKGLKEYILDDQTDRRTLVGMVPFPLRKFDGPAIGGLSTNSIYTIAPGRKSGSPYGWTKGVMTKNDAGPIAPIRFMDVIDQDLLQKTKMKLKIKRLE